jgi:hypothetical protein
MGVLRACLHAAGWVLLGLAGGVHPARGGTLTIHDLQVSSAAQEWKSAYEGQVVSLTGGVVTHTIGFRITLQDPAAGDAWAGLEIRAYENEAPLGVVRVGDRVDFHDILVEEFRGGTIPQFKTYSSFEIISSGNPLPDPVRVSLADVAYPPDRERCERYEGMLVTIENVRVGEMDLGKADDNYQLTDGVHTVWGSDYYNLDLAVPPFPKYQVARGERYARVTGVLQEYAYPVEGWDYYQILPRGSADYERSEIHTIRDVQESTAADGWRSLLEGTRVSVQGVVSAERSPSALLALCDRLLGPAWSGVLVSDPSASLAGLLRGDEVLLEQVLVVESGGQTTLLYDAESRHTVTSAGNGVAAQGVEPWELARSGGAETSERYEGMLVALYNLDVVRCGVAEGDSLYYLAAGPDTVLATDLDGGLIPLGQTFFVRPGDRLGRIRGLVLERALPGGGRAYVLAPRSAEDYVFMASANELYTSWGRLKERFR